MFNVFHWWLKRNSTNMATLTFSTRKSATWSYYPALGPHQSDVFCKCLVCWTTEAKATLSNPKWLMKECLMMVHGSNEFSIISLWKPPHGTFIYKSALLKCSSNNNSFYLSAFLNTHGHLTWSKLVKTVTINKQLISIKKFDNTTDTYIINTIKAW